jgi:hypothetical protein
MQRFFFCFLIFSSKPRINVECVVGEAGGGQIYCSDLLAKAFPYIVSQLLVQCCTRLLKYVEQEGRFEAALRGAIRAADQDIVLLRRRALRKRRVQAPRGWDVASDGE